MSLVGLIRERLAPLAPEILEVEDDSAAHAGNAGARDGGGHFNVLIVAEAFTGKAGVARHRLVYDAVRDLMPARIHALAITARTPDENRRQS